MSLIVVRFTRLPTPPLTITPSNAPDYSPWYEAIQTTSHHDAPQAWRDFSRTLVSAIHNHHRHYRFWNYKICTVEMMWKLGRGQHAPQTLYAFARNDEYLEVWEGQHERIATALAAQDRKSGNFLCVEYQAGESRQGMLGLVSFMEVERGREGEGGRGGGVLFGFGLVWSGVGCLEG
ncbi:hypothetical protein EAE96_002149 [Botrytis aclada]|nr:hypothetical protein EAE96_002149 [Botrytis aclada]